MNSDSVYRTRLLPTGSLQNRFTITDSVLESTVRALRTFREAAVQHEGIVFWGGTQTSSRTALNAVAVPRAQHRPGGVSVDEQSVGQVVQSFRRHGLGLLAQIHSHPGGDARHSDGDDLVLMPFEGMLSIVVPWYAADGMVPMTMCGVHQFQAGRWVLCTHGLENISVVPTVIDLR